MQLDLFKVLAFFGTSTIFHLGELCIMVQQVLYGTLFLRPWQHNN